MLNWSDIRGHRRTMDVLERAVDTGRVHHAYLFAGPSGIGKRSVALAFAAALNCVERPEDEFREACGTCVSCRKVWHIQHPDLHVVEPDGTRIKIDQIRVIQKAAMTRPYEARHQIVIIDEAHRMTTEAANALLKTLEEPPDTMRLIVVTDQPHNLLDTIRSRCQLVRFAPLDPAVVSDLLEAQLVDDEEIDRALFTVAAGYGEGSAGRALEILNSGALEERAEIVSRLRELTNRRPIELLDWAESWAKERNQLGERLETLKVMYRDVMLLETSGRKERLVNRDLADDLEALADDLNVEEVLARIDLIDDAQSMLDRNVHPQLIAEDLLLKLAPPAG